MKKLLLLTCIVPISYATQVVQIQATLPTNSSDANFLFILEDSDTGKKTAESIYLHAGKNLATFQVEGDHYRVIPANLEAPHQQFTPCAPTQLISNHSLIITITGKIAPNELRCNYRETTTLPDLYTHTAASASAATTSAPVTTDPNAGSKAIANYLTALSKDCQKGKFIADFDSQSVTYNILGMNAGHCEVNINTNQSLPLTCQFNQNDIALLSSPTEIESYKLGTAQYSDNSLSARIMKARCKAETTKK
ncbi:MAG: hypothetical protein V4496_06345 [Pseudomonadota bacterium]